jgi:hypothetical protein
MNGAPPNGNPPPQTGNGKNVDKFEFLLPYAKALLRPDEASDCLDLSRNHIYSLILEGKLEAHADSERERLTYRITRRSVLARLAKTAQYEPDDFLEVLETLIKTLSASQIDRLIVRAQRIKEEKGGS